MWGQGAEVEVEAGEKPLFLSSNPFRAAGMKRGTGNEGEAPHPDQVCLPESVSRAFGT